VRVVRVWVLCAVVGCLLVAQADVWQKWSDMADNICLKMTKQAGLSEGRCDNLQQVIEDVMQDLALKMTSAMKDTKKPLEYLDELASNSLKFPYRAEGEQIIKETVKWVMDNNIVSQREIQNYFTTKFGQWFMNLAVDNKQKAMQRNLGRTGISTPTNSEDFVKHLNEQSKHEGEELGGEQEEEEEDEEDEL